jgi:hypothetical protein
MEKIQEFFSNNHIEEHCDGCAYSIKQYEKEQGPVVDRQLGKTPYDDARDDPEWNLLGMNDNTYHSSVYRILV